MASAADPAAASTADRPGVGSAPPYSHRGATKGRSEVTQLLTGLPYDFVDTIANWEQQIGFPVQEKSVCACDNTPHAIHTGAETAEQYKKENENGIVGQHVGLAIADPGQTCKAVCEKRLDDDGEPVPSAREMLDDLLTKDAKLLGYTSSSDAGFKELSFLPEFEDICACNLELHPEKGKGMALATTQSFRKDLGIEANEYELEIKTRELAGKMMDPGKDVVYATIPLGDKTQCPAQCKRTVEMINQNHNRHHATLRSNTAEFLGTGYAEETPIGILSDAPRPSDNFGGVPGDGQFATYDDDPATLYSLEKLFPPKK